MRTQASNEQYFNFVGESSLKIVNEYREQYEQLSLVAGFQPGSVIAGSSGLVSVAVHLR
jgi:hypothetical protein